MAAKTEPPSIETPLIGAYQDTTMTLEYKEYGVSDPVVNCTIIVSDKRRVGTVG